MIYNAGIYCRLSKEDSNAAESASIINQRRMLEKYAADNDFNIYDIYIDDGYSGTNFNRPAFKRLERDIKAGLVNLVIVKDLSRLGRDYITNGRLLEELFPMYRCRFIAVTDGYDSNDKYNEDIAPFKNIINELYARDISKKIRSALITKMQAGQYVAAYAPYGYKKAADNKNRLIADPETAPVVRFIFSRLICGLRPADTANMLNEKGIKPPAVYRNPEKSGLWTSAAVQKISKRLVYAGHTVQHKTTKLSFKSKTVTPNAESDWIVVKNTHEALITQEVFDAVQKISARRKSSNESGFKNIFSGAAKCGDCGAQMSLTASRRNGSRYNLVCGRYKLYGIKGCSNHFTDYGGISAITLKALKEHLSLSEKQLDETTSRLYKEYETLRKAEKGRLSAIQTRRAELETLIIRAYEDKSLKKIPQELFISMTKSFVAEEEKLRAEADKLTGVIADSEEKIKSDIKSTENLITHPDELDLKTIHRFIGKITVYQGEYEYIGNRKLKRQRLEIHFKFKAEHKNTFSCAWDSDATPQASSDAVSSTPRGNGS